MIKGALGRQLCVVVLIVTLLVSLTPRRVDPAMAVFDGSNLAQNVMTVAHLLQIIGMTSRDLASLTNIGPILQILAQLQAVMNDITIVVSQVERRMVGWGQLTATIPCTSRDLRSWNGQAAEWARQGAAEARMVTTLLHRTVGLIQNLTQLVGMIGGLFGTTSGLQSVSALTSVVAIEVQKMQAMTLPFQQVVLGQQQMEQVNQLASICIQNRLFESWGTVTQTR